MQGKGSIFIPTLGLLLIQAWELPAQNPTPVLKRRVFVLHSGVHILLAPEYKNEAAKTLKQSLLDRSVASSDIIALDSPFPQASWQDPFPRAGVLLYLESTDPASRSSREAYLRLDKALQKHGVTAQDQLVWIGHSAGGQLGMSMASLAHRLANYPDLAKLSHPYQFAMVITLGSAVGHRPVPAEVQLRHYYSSADTMVYMLSKHGKVVGDSVGFPVRFGPAHEHGANVKIRVFADIEHPSWYTQGQVLDSIFREFEAVDRPLWRRSQADVGRGTGLAQLLANTLEAHWRISLEEP